jgi:hypothetical protein
MTTPTAAPSLKLRRIDWGDGGRPREDYEVVDARGGGYAWNWAVYGIAVANHPPAGQAPTWEAAQAAFKAAWAGAGLSASYRDASSRHARIRPDADHKLNFLQALRGIEWVNLGSEDPRKLCTFLAILVTAIRLRSAANFLSAVDRAEPRSTGNCGPQFGRCNQQAPIAEICS